MVEDSTQGNVTAAEEVQGRDFGLNLRWLAQVASVRGSARRCTGHLLGPFKLLDARCTAQWPQAILLELVPEPFGNGCEQEKCLTPGSIDLRPLDILIWQSS